MAATQPADAIHYVYALGDPAAAAPARCSARVEVRTGEALAGVAVDGARARVALWRTPRASGRALRSDAAEQFFFVLEGRLVADIGGQLLTVPAQHALHVPPATPHALYAAEDSAFIVAVARGAAPVEPGDWQSGAAPGAPRTTGDGTVPRYVYAIDTLDAVPPGASSAKVVAKNFVSGKSSSFGAALSGAALHVGVIHKARGSGAKLHTHPNEQFNVVLEGTLIGEIAGAQMEVVPYGLIHMPAGVQHCTAASGAGDLTVFVVKDTSHGLSGPPVDGIEDGPRYLPGFGPQS